MTKKRKTRKKISKKVSFWQKYKKFCYIFISIFISAFLIYLTFDNIKSAFKEKKTEKKSYPNKKLLEKMNKLLKEEKRKVDILKKELNKIKERKKITIAIKKVKSKKIVSSEVIDYKKSLETHKNTKKVKSKTTLKVKTNKPLLAIIIDDVAYQNEVKKIKALSFKVTPSFFPPTKRHPNTPKFAREFNFYMVHLPLQALHYPHPEPQTLLATSSQKDIDTRIENIKKWFPKDKFINNHTGSYFTSNYQAMIKLYKALNKNGIIFIDSRTSADTVAPKIAKIFHQKLLSRDIFIDNIANISYIQDQLKKAVKKAKKYGYAIAIGHPHLKTLQALRESKNIFKDIKLVYVSSIYENIKTNTK